MSIYCILLLQVILTEGFTYMPLNLCLSTYRPTSISNLFPEPSSSSGIECECVHSITSTMVSDTQMAVPLNSALFKVLFLQLIC